ncbi:zinc finger (CCCH type) motif-containing protein [Besnoitia besnoiti]|uniref:Zinc finger (CCCH type) motif-containing protein n=1 Tax=Besnoitia besnoiti TaxID=94643 RepID=A0A2A9MCW4_BESBE|nr:zinc finger (CCCH type) motif-containing protein [Besnoitia besnoiti]PFH33513.1 zinc finger (CCCH type) motif-containing protein [Besnoitia besnoiti]
MASFASTSTSPGSLRGTPPRVTPRMHHHSVFRYSPGASRSLNQGDKPGKPGKLAQGSVASTPSLGNYGGAGKQTGNQPGSAIVASQMFKTKLCIDNQTKGCTRGADCPYAHSVGEMRSLPDLRKTKMCSLVLAGKGCKNKACRFAHSEDELRYTCNFSEFKTRICRFAQEQGGRGCLYGVRCPYAHSPSELRRLESPTIPPTEILVHDRKSHVPFVSKASHSKLGQPTPQPPSSPLMKRPETAHDTKKKMSESLENEMQGRHGCWPLPQSGNRRKQDNCGRAAGEGDEASTVSLAKRIHLAKKTETKDGVTQAAEGVHLLTTETHVEPYKAQAREHEERFPASENDNGGPLSASRGTEGGSRIPRSLTRGRRAVAAKTENVSTELQGKGFPCFTAEPRTAGFSENPSAVLRDHSSAEEAPPSVQGAPMRIMSPNEAPLLVQSQQQQLFTAPPIMATHSLVSPAERETGYDPCTLLRNNGTLGTTSLGSNLSPNAFCSSDMDTSGQATKQSFSLEASTSSFEPVSMASAALITPTPPCWAQSRDTPSGNTGFVTEDMLFRMSPQKASMDEGAFDSAFKSSLHLVASAAVADKRKPPVKSQTPAPLQPPPGFEHIRLEKKADPCGSKLQDMMAESIAKNVLSSSFCANEEDQHENILLQLRRQLLLQCWGKAEEDSLFLQRNVPPSPPSEVEQNGEGNFKRVPAALAPSLESLSRPALATQPPADWSAWESELQAAQPAKHFGGIGSQRGIRVSDLMAPGGFRQVFTSEEAPHKPFFGIQGSPESLLAGLVAVREVDSSLLDADAAAHHDRQIDTAMHEGSSRLEHQGNPMSLKAWESDVMQ